MLIELYMTDNGRPENACTQANMSVAVNTHTQARALFEDARAAGSGPGTHIYDTINSAVCCWLADIKSKSARPNDNIRIYVCEYNLLLCLCFWQCHCFCGIFHGIAFILRKYSLSQTNWAIKYLQCFCVLYFVCHQNATRPRSRSWTRLFTRSHRCRQCTWTGHPIQFVQKNRHGKFGVPQRRERGIWQNCIQTIWATIGLQHGNLECFHCNLTTISRIYISFSVRGQRCWRGNLVQYPIHR